MTHAPISRRALLAGATGALGAHALRVTKLAQDPTKVPGSAVTPLGERSPFERPRRIPLGNGQGISYTRSEEHTSELQSQSNLVCRLLLEKKKKNISRGQHHQPDKHCIQRI